jgi:PKHD-type hydroxylase
MILTFKEVINQREHDAIMALVEQARFVDGRQSAGQTLADTKHNEQLPADSGELQKIAQILIAALQRNARFMDATYPQQLHSMLVSRYRPGMSYGKHVDSALMGKPIRLRTDLSLTLFLNEPEDYDGGELAIETGSGEHTWKLNARDLVVYPTNQLHEVREITRGERLAVVGWIKSNVQDHRAREVLFDLAEAKSRLWAQGGRSEVFTLVNKAHTNLLRRWAE